MIKEKGKNKRDQKSMNKATSRPWQKVTYWGPGGGGGGPIRTGLSDTFPPAPDLKRADADFPLNKLACQKYNA